MKHYPVTQTSMKNWSKAYQASPERQLATMALFRNQMNQVDVRAAKASTLRHKFSVEIKTLDVTNQKHSGRCWLFAAANVVREKIAADLISSINRETKDSSRGKCPAPERDSSNN